MVCLDRVRATNVDLVSSQPLVAVFVGGTSGIGSYAAKALAEMARPEHGLRLYVVGRNQSAADGLLDECRKAFPSGDFRFVQANDIALLSDVDRVCAEITKLEEEETSKHGRKPHIDLLIMTQAYLAFEARRETKEGLDTLMSLIYYSRIRLIEKFLPLLLQSQLPARIMSVFGPQKDSKLFLDDISLRNPKNYGFGTMGSHVAYMKTFYFEYLAAKYPTLAFTHYFPNLVVTEAFTGDRTNAWFKSLWKIMYPLAKLITVPEKECAQRVLFLASDRFPASAYSPRKLVDGVQVAESSDGRLGGGAYRVDWNGELIAVKKNYEQLRADGVGEKLVAHTQEVFRCIEAGRVFRD